MVTKITFSNVCTVIVPTSGCLFNCFFVLNEINTWLLWCLIKKKSVMEFRMVLYEVNEL